jgi:hypothetical protein
MLSDKTIGKRRWLVKRLLSSCAGFDSARFYVRYASRIPAWILAMPAIQRS